MVMNLESHIWVRNLRRIRVDSFFYADFWIGLAADFETDMTPFETWSPYVFNNDLTPTLDRPLLPLLETSFDYSIPTNLGRFQIGFPTLFTAINWPVQELRWDVSYPRHYLTCVQKLTGNKMYNRSLLPSGITRHLLILPLLARMNTWGPQHTWMLQFLILVSNR